MPKLVPNTSLAAQGEVAHRLERHLRPIHNNAKSGAHSSWLPPDFNMADGAGLERGTFQVYWALLLKTLFNLGRGGVKNSSKLG